MGSFRLLGIVLGIASCGRVGFEPGSNPRDASSDGDSPGDTSSSLCASAGLIAHWRFDETSGATVFDATGNTNGQWLDSNDGDLANEAMAGRRAGALFFDTGSSVFVPGFVVPAKGTFSAWLTSNFDESVAFSGFHPMVFDAPSPRTTLTFDSDLRVYGLRTNDVSYQASYAPPGNLVGWFHLTATWSAIGAQLYVDGTPVGTPSATDSRSVSGAGLYLGTREGADRLWNGLIDDVRFYNYPMTAADVAELYGCP